MSDFPKRDDHQISVDIAAIELSAAICGIIRKYDLTFGEITRILSQEILSWAYTQIKEERKGKHK